MGVVWVYGDVVQQNGSERIQTQSTILSSAKGRDLSMGRRPVINSRRTTPNEKTSDLSVSFPLEAYSGAK